VLSGVDLGTAAVISDSGTPIGSAAVQGDDGSAVLVTPDLAARSHSIVATYGGTPR